MSNNKYYKIANLSKSFDKLKIETILEIGNSLGIEKATKFREEQVYLASGNKIDEVIKFPTANDAIFRLNDLVSYVNNNPDNLDRVELAAAFAYGFCMVHPFGDGNGRTSRTLANHFLKENELFLQLTTDRTDYRTACLAINNTGDLNSMYEYFKKRLK